MRLLLLTVLSLLNASASADETLFTRVDQEAGLNFTNEAGEERIQFANSRHLFLGAGVAVGDVDGNQLPDVFLVSNSGPNKLFLQKEPWKFVDATEFAGGLDGGKSWGFGASFADIDGDGDLDLFVANFGAPNELYVNQGDGTFKEEAKLRGVDIDGACVLASFSDYDQDGDLDFYLLTYRLFDLELLQPDFKMPLSPNGAPIIPKELKWEYEMRHGVAIRRGRQDFLFQNDGTGNFTDVTKESGILEDSYTHGLSATWCDFDDDGDDDLHVSNDFWGPDKLWRNKGDGTFENVMTEMMPGTSWFSMGADWGDLNNDGRFDLVVADMAGTTHFREKLGMGAMSNSNWFLKMERPQQSMRNHVFLQSGKGRFLEGAYFSGMAATDWTWSSLVGDLDNDGALDVFFTNGIGRDMQDSDLVSEISRNFYSGNREEADRLFRALPRAPQKNHAFRNTESGRFEVVGEPWGLDLNGVSHGAVLADLDRDGDLDVIVNNENEPAALYRNESRQNSGLGVQLVGNANNRFGLGAKLALELDSGKTQIRRIAQARGYASGAEPVAHFGIPEGATVKSLKIRWPNGANQRIEDIKAGRFYTIEEKPGFVTLPVTEKTPPQFETIPFADWSHQEIPFDDFADQPLLPWQHSQLGPGMAWGDVDGDGDDDCFVGGGMGQPSQLFFAEADRKFTPAVAFPDETERPHETMAAVFSDFDADGDLDLLVTSGGVEDAAQNRFYLNDGSGKFVRDERFPTLEGGGGSSIAAYDFDQDGDLDFFIGGRILPGQFPASPTSLLLRNEGGKFLVHQKLKIGMVTGAIWSDINNDGAAELLVCTAWEPIRVFHHESGKLLETAPETTGLANFSGWWQGIAGADFDHDGDIDFVATNMGRNTKYKKKVILFHHDFDANGRTDLVEAKNENGVLKPVRGFSCSSAAVPAIREKFTTFRQFAGASLVDIYQEKEIESAEKVEINWFETSLLINDGTGRFEVKPLPGIAQISPGFGVVCEDFDGDGNTDIVVGQNFSQTQPETSRWNGGVGVFLKGDGRANFEPVWPTDSGVLIPGDARALTTKDIDGDGWLDLVGAVNADKPVAFRNSGSEENRMLYFKWSPEDAGSRVTMQFSDGQTDVRELYLGSGYLSQQPTTLGFGVPKGSEPVKITIRKPDRAIEEQKIEGPLQHGDVISFP